MQWLIFLFGLALLWAFGGPTALRAEMASTWSLSAEAQRGGFSLRTSLVWDNGGPRPEVALAFSPQPPTAAITFRTDSLSCVLVRSGQVLVEGDLLGYASAKGKARLEELRARLPKVADELVRAELLAEIERLAEENEIRALIPGRVLSVEVSQEGAEIKVQVLVEKP